jgi:hypothetical protein
VALVWRDDLDLCIIGTKRGEDVFWDIIRDIEPTDPSGEIDLQQQRDRQKE